MRIWTGRILRFIRILRARWHMLNLSFLLVSLRLEVTVKVHPFTAQPVGPVVRFWLSANTANFVRFFVALVRLVWLVDPVVHFFSSDDYNTVYPPSARPAINKNSP